jgi:hypothetical protein
MNLLNTNYETANLILVRTRKNLKEFSSTL